MTTEEEVQYVTYIARKIGKHLRVDGLISLSELVSEGWIALQEAKKKYVSGRRSALTTYAHRRVAGAMQDYIYRHAPRGYRRQGGTGVPFEWPIRGGLLTCDYDDDRNSTVDDVEHKVELAQVNKVVISRRLKARERKILIRRSAGEPLRTLADEYGISRTRVYQIHVAAAAKVKVIVSGGGKKKIKVKRRKN